MPRPYHRHGQSFDPELSRGIIGIVLVIAAILFVLSFLGKAGAVGIMLDEYILSFLFGSMRYAAPAIILILAFFFFKDIEYNYRKTHGIGAILFFLSLSSLFHLSFNPADMWTMALEGNGGGIFGMLAWPLKTYLGSIASIVVLIGMAAVSVFLIFNTALTHFVLLNKKLFAGLGLAGQAIINLFKLFVKTTNNGVQVNGEFEEYESEDGEDVESVGNVEIDESDDEEADVGKQRAFVKKAMAGNGNGDEEETEEALRQAQGKEKVSSPWTKRVIIKNLPPLSLLTTKRDKPTSGDIEANAHAIHSMLAEFGMEVEMGEIRVGPAVTQYSLRPSKGIKLSRITSLSNDLALALAAHPIRIEAPIPGKSLVGIEVPNFKAAIVTLKELLESREFSEREHNLMIALGKDVAGKVWFADLSRMPHLLVAGATGSGKTVCINTIIMSLLYQNTAETLRFIMVDPKRVELTLYNGIPHLLAPVITNVSKTVNALKWTTGEMDRRFEILAQSGSRDIHSYNAKFPNTKLPHIIFIIDELADLMAAAASEVEAGIIRLAQMARAVGIHLIVATQRPSVDILTGLMKANIPARIAFSVASIIDSRVILDCPGADKLLGRGDMLFLTAELSKPKRIQGACVSEDEVKNVVDNLKGEEEPEYDESVVGKSAGGTVSMFGGPSDDHDVMFDEAKAIILQAGKASASLLQRRMKVGYARAARILDEMEASGIIGPADGAKPREILTTEIEVSGTDSGGEFNVFDEEEDENSGDKGDNEDNEDGEDIIEAEEDKESIEEDEEVGEEESGGVDGEEEVGEKKEKEGESDDEMV